MNENANIPQRTITRLCLYRRILLMLLPEGREYVRSQEIATLARGSSAQVRRDIMSLGYAGLPSKGYRVHDLLASIAELLDAPEVESVALVGVGNLGHALLSYLVGRRPNLTIRAAFDANPALQGLAIHGCPCYRPEDMETVLSNYTIRTAILAVPAGTAQAAAERLIACGIRSILNFAPTRLNLPKHVYVEDMDISASLERAAFYARRLDDEAPQPAHS